METLAEEIPYSQTSKHLSLFYWPRSHAWGTIEGAQKLITLICARPTLWAQEFSQA